MSCALQKSYILRGLMLAVSALAGGCEDSVEPDEDEVAAAEIAPMEKTGALKFSSEPFAILCPFMPTYSEFGSVDYKGADPYDLRIGYWADSCSTCDHDYSLQGLAYSVENGQTRVFFATRYRLYTWDATDDTNFGLHKDPPSDARYVSIPSALRDKYNHFGDPDTVVVDGVPLVYVPLENDQKRYDPVVAVYRANSTLSFVGWSTMSNKPTNNLPWLALRHGNGADVYTSCWDITSGCGVVVYKDTDAGLGIDLGRHKDVPVVNSSGQSLSIESVQGGDFNQSGYLFLLATDGSEGSGIYVLKPNACDFDRLERFTFIAHIPAEVHPSSKNEEFEGLAVTDINPPGDGNRSQIHALLVRYEAVTDDVYFKHWGFEHPGSFF